METEDPLELQVISRLQGSIILEKINVLEERVCGIHPTEVSIHPQAPSPDLQEYPNLDLATLTSAGGWETC